MALIYSFLTITLRANQNVTGLALTTFGIGLGNFFGGSLLKLFGETGSISLMNCGAAFKASLPFADDLGLFGKTFLSFGFLTYLAVIIAFAASFVLNKTRVGLNLRAVGENPATADSAGINVVRYKYMATCIGSGIAALGGLFYIMDFGGTPESYKTIESLGWLAVALVIFTLWKPLIGIVGSIIFGMLYLAGTYIPTMLDINLSLAQSDLLKLLPYVVTVIVLIVSSISKKRENQPPAALGLPYFREER
jgi:simple sugar transport system permease protein